MPSVFGFECHGAMLGCHIELPKDGNSGVLVASERGAERLNLWSKTSPHHLQAINVHQHAICILSANLARFWCNMPLHMQ